ncbi:MAG TPA: SpoIIE family protein phosphatase [Gemmatimonadales bacterium]|nr:SpoIIE family protein phosphatase [Gemmatimonadales bacterium]
MPAPTRIDWGVAKRTLPGERESGDLHLVKQRPSGVLVCVVDGLGHGAQAAAAARTAVQTVERSAGEAVGAVLERCHRALVGTRGVVMSLAAFDGADEGAGAMTWLGVGNVEGVLVYGDPTRRPAKTSLLTRGGIVGSELPPLRAQVVPVAPGDTLIFATDGIEDTFAHDLPSDASPQQLADYVLARHGKGTDDALVLVARYAGRGAGS